MTDDDVDEWGWLELGPAAGGGRRTGCVTVRWGPRTLDVDVVTVDGVTSDHPDLLLPHPGTPERATVLIPWLDIDPDAVLPGHGQVRDVLAAAGHGGRDPQGRPGVWGCGEVHPRA